MVTPGHIRGDAFDICRHTEGPEADLPVRGISPLKPGTVSEAKGRGPQTLLVHMDRLRVLWLRSL